MRRLIWVLAGWCGLLNGQIAMSNRVARAVMVEPGSSATVVFTGDPLPDGGDMFDVASQSAGAVVTLVLPNGTEIGAANAESQGITYSVLAAGSTLPGLFAVGGTHTLITLGAGSLPGEYTVRVAAGGAESAFVAVATYQSSSGVRAGVAVGDETAPVGQPVVFTGLVADGESRLMDAAVELALLSEDPALPSVPLTMTANLFAEQGVEGMYGGTWTPETPGRYRVVLTARGISPAGVAYERQATTEVVVTPALARLTSVADAAVDETGDGTLERLDVTLGLDVTQEGRYRLAASLVSASGRTVTAQRVLTLKAGAQAVALPFAPAVLGLLQEDGPYSRNDSAVVYEGDGTPVMADRRPSGGPSGAYAPAMFTPEAAPRFLLSSARLSFGPVAVKTTKDLSLRVVNEGAAAITQNKAKPSDAAFTIVEPAVPFTVPAGGEVALTVRFSPTTTSGKSGTLVLGGTTVHLDGTGAAAAPVMRVAPASLDFGTVASGSSKDLVFTVRNLGGAVLTLSSVESNAAQYSLPDVTAPLVVEPGEARDVTVRFTPSAAGTKSGTITVKGDDPAAASARVTVTGKS